MKYDGILWVLLSGTIIIIQWNRVLHGTYFIRESMIFSTKFIQKRLIIPHVSIIIKKYLF